MSLYHIACPYHINQTCVTPCCPLFTLHVHLSTRSDPLPSPLLPTPTPYHYKHLPIPDVSCNCIDRAEIKGETFVVTLLAQTTLFTVRPPFSVISEARVTLIGLFLRSNAYEFKGLYNLKNNLFNQFYCIFSDCSDLPDMTDHI